MRNQRTFHFTSRHRSSIAFHYLIEFFLHNTNFTSNKYFFLRTFFFLNKNHNLNDKKNRVLSMANKEARQKHYQNSKRVVNDIKFQIAEISFVVLCVIFQDPL